MKLILSLFLSLSTFLLFAQETNKLKTLVRQVDMYFTMPENFISTDVKYNEAMEYDYAMRSKTLNDTEVRFAVRPITLKKYANAEEREAYQERVSAENKYYKLYLTTIILNLSNGVQFPIEEPGYIAELKFYADWVGKSTIILNSDFAPEFKYCHIIAIHKKNKATCYYFHLANTLEDLSALVPKVYGKLGFRR